MSSEKKIMYSDVCVTVCAFRLGPDRNYANYICNYFWQNCKERKRKGFENKHGDVFS